MIARLLLIGSFVATAAAFAGSASAATIGGVNAQELASFEVVGPSGAPTVLTWENFDGTNGTNISGTSPDWGPGTWRSIGGTWRIQGNQADSTSVSLGSINVHVAGITDAATEVTVDRFGSTNFDAGILFNDNNYSVLVLRYRSVSNGTLALYSWNGSYALLASVTNLYPGGIATAPASVTLRVRASGSAVEAFIDGASQFTYTLSAAEQSIFKSSTHTGYGMWTEFDTTSKFDNFHVDTP